MISLSLPFPADNKLKCTLCGSQNPWVTCAECAGQIFCASCDDMFHKHPKRKQHIRKARLDNQYSKESTPTNYAIYSLPPTGRGAGNATNTAQGTGWCRTTGGTTTTQQARTADTVSGPQGTGTPLHDFLNQNTNSVQVPKPVKPVSVAPVAPLYRLVPVCN